MNDNSNYGRVFGSSRRATSPRSTGAPPSSSSATGAPTTAPTGPTWSRRLRERARGVYWLCPEGRGTLGERRQRDARLRDRSNRVLEARTAAELEQRRARS